jgi:hypothetical protein
MKTEPIMIIYTYAGNGGTVTTKFNLKYGWIEVKKQKESPKCYDIGTLGTHWQMNDMLNDFKRDNKEFTRQLIF